MRKKILTLGLTLLTSFSLIGCGKSDDSDNKKYSYDTSNFFCYKTSDSKKDENGNISRTFYFTNEDTQFDLTYKILNNFEISDFYYGTALITNDSYGYNRYMLVDSKGNEIIPYDTYSYIERLGKTKYFSFSSSDKSTRKYGIINSDNKQIMDERYISIHLLPTDEKVIFLCNKEDNIYDIRHENGSILIENVTISDVDECRYYISQFSDNKTGLIVIQSNDRQIIISEDNGNILCDNAQNVNESILDSFMPPSNSGESHLYMVSDDATNFYPISDEFMYCNIFAIKDLRYIYDSDGVILAKYSDSGSLTEKPTDGNIIHTIETPKTRSVIIESEDKYSVKNYTNREVAKYNKSEYELVECTSFGYIMKKDEQYIFCSADGKTLYENLTFEGSYKKDENTALYYFGDTIIEMPFNDTVSYTSETCGVCLTCNFADNRYSLSLRDDKGILFGFDQDIFISIDDSNGYILINTKQGTYTKNGKLLYE